MGSEVDMNLGGGGSLHGFLEVHGPLIKLWLVQWPNLRLMRVDVSLNIRRHSWTLWRVTGIGPTLNNGFTKHSFYRQRLKVDFKQFRQNGKYFSTQLSSLPLSTRVKAAVFAADLPLKDVPQKSLVRGTVDVRGSLVRAVICHFKRRYLSKSRHQHRVPAVPRSKLLMGRSESDSVKRLRLPASSRTGAWPTIHHFPETRWCHTMRFSA